MRSRVPSAACFVSAFLACAPASAAERTTLPNIVYVLADDLGYGDVKALNPEGKIATPNMNRLAAQGMAFTDAHSGSAVCSPTRYGIMTGRYCWRSPLKTGVLGGLSPRLIEPGRLTVAQFLKDNGYHTACLGKWHLGMNWVVKPGLKVTNLGIETADQIHNVEYDKPIAGGPRSLGFDHYFGLSGSLDMVPYAFIENERVTAVPTEDRNFPLMGGHADTRPTRKGPAAPGFEAADVLPTLVRKATAYIGERAKAGGPFFLYLPLNAPHTPIAPAAAWKAKSGLNPYADFVMQTDSALGEVLKAIDEAGVAENTLVVMTSDNGCSPLARFPELLAKGHNPSYAFRGHKADIYEGGHRVPFLVRWPAVVKPGTKSDRLAGLGDLMATCAAILGKPLPANAGEDSISLLSALKGTAAQPVRETLVNHSLQGAFAIREGKWKLCLCPGAGGFPVPPKKGAVAPPPLPPVQLFDLSADIGEKVNLQDKHPEIVARLTALLERQVADGRSTPGARRENTAPVSIWQK